MAFRLGLNDLHALIDRAQNDRLEWCDLEVFIVVHFIQNIERNDSLRLGKKVSFEQVANGAARLEPLVATELVIELLQALLKCLVVRTKNVQKLLLLLELGLIGDLLGLAWFRRL